MILYMIRIIIVSCIVVLLLGPIVIPFLKKLKASQSEREEGLESHKTKSGTTTMGGIMMILGIYIATLTSGVYTKEIWICLLTITGFGVIGFLDDYIKVVLKRNLGLTAIQKIIGQFVFALILAIYGAKYSINGTKLIIPFTSIYINFGIFYIPFTVFCILGIVNGVNLTDGLDGLNSGVTLIVMAAFALILNGLMKANIAYKGFVIICCATVGACLGFLRYNAHPAKVFMGDTGSLMLGGAVSAVAVSSSLTLLVPIIGIIYVAEVLSDIIQVTHYKRTKRRIFKMAPLHHHFEACGWKETKVVLVFWLVSLIFAFVGIYAV